MVGGRTPVFSDTHDGGRHNSNIEELVGPRSSSYSVFTDGELASGKISAAPVFTAGKRRRGGETGTRREPASGRLHDASGNHRETSRRETGIGKTTKNQRGSGTGNASRRVGEPKTGTSGNTESAMSGNTSRWETHQENPGKRDRGTDGNVHRKNGRRREKSTTGGERRQHDTETCSSSTVVSGTSGSGNGNTTGITPVVGKTPGPCGHFVKHMVAEASGREHAAAAAARHSDGDRQRSSHWRVRRRRRRARGRAWPGRRKRAMEKNSGRRGCGWCGCDGERGSLGKGERGSRRGAMGERGREAGETGRGEGEGERERPTGRRRAGGRGVTGRCRAGPTAAGRGTVGTAGEGGVGRRG